MPSLTATIPHQLTRAEAKRRLQEQIGAMRGGSGGFLTEIKETWAGDRMDFTVQAAGQSIAGHMIVGDHAVHLNLALPWILTMMAKTIKHRIEQDVQRLLMPPPK